MLKEFTFRNCYSFKDEATLSMKAIYAMKDNVDFIIEAGDEGNRDYILPVAAIYGANAGGKSNVIRALRDAAQNICERKDWVLNRPFALTDKRSDELQHSLRLLIDKHEYSYSYIASCIYDEIIEETLQKRSIGRKDTEFETVFHRKGERVISGTIMDSPDFVSIENAAANLSYLIVNSVGTMRIPDCSNIYQWCESVLAVTLIKSEKERKEHLDGYAGYLVENVEANERLTRFMQKFDPAIAHITPFDESRDVPNEKHFSLAIGHNYRKEDESIGTRFFRAQWESGGTQKMLELYPMLIDALDNGKPFVIDELDTMLHPLIFKKFVALFNDKETNPKNAQLIFAAHNTEVMNREDLRRDEIHIVEKNGEDSTSSMCRLSDYEDENGKKVRMDARYDRMYLEGLLGSIPSGFQDVKV